MDGENLNVNDDFFSDFDLSDTKLDGELVDVVGGSKDEAEKPFGDDFSLGEEFGESPMQTEESDPSSLFGSDSNEEPTDSTDGSTESSSEDDFDFDSMLITEDSDLSKYENAEDSGDLVVLAIASGTRLVYFAHGTEGKLAATIRYMRKVLGGGLVEIKLEDNVDIEALKEDSAKFEEAFKKYI